IEPGSTRRWATSARRSSSWPTLLNRVSEIRGQDHKTNALKLTLESYTFSGFNAHVALRAEYLRDGVPVINKRYQSDGVSQGGKMFWGGAFAMKNAIQQSTKLAVDEILKSLIADLNEKSG